MTAMRSESTSGYALRDERREPLRVADLVVAALELDEACGGAGPRSRSGRAAWAAGSSLVGLVVREPARRVVEHVVAVLREPVVVPVVLVGAVALVVRGLPLVLVVAEAVQHHDQRMARARALHRLGHVHVERRAVEARRRCPSRCARRRRSRRSAFSVGQDGVNVGRQSGAAEALAGGTSISARPRPQQIDPRLMERAGSRRACPPKRDNRASVSAARARPCRWRRGRRSA